MDIRGGLNMYTFFVKAGEIKQTRHLSDESPYGRKVRFLNKHGYEYDRKHACQHMAENQVLTVNEIYVGTSSSEVSFVEIPGHKFNTVMFEDIK